VFKQNVLKQNPSDRWEWSHILPISSHISDLRTIWTGVFYAAHWSSPCKSWEDLFSGVQKHS